MKLISNFSARLSILIKETELTYEELGARIGENPSTLNRYALGQRIPKIDVANELASKLGVNPLWLMGFDVEKSENIKPAETIDRLKGEVNDMAMRMTERQLHALVEYAKILKDVPHNRLKE